MMMTAEGDMRSEVRHMCTREKENIGNNVEMVWKYGKMGEDRMVTILF